jgi:CrcB protein
MKDLFLIALGGALGTLGRFKLSSALSGLVICSSIPLSIVIVNACGCFAAGALLSVAERFNFLSSEARAFLFVGVLGGFTTFSAFGIEALTLLRTASVLAMLSYVGLSVVGGLAAVWLGFAIFKG